MHKKRRWHGWTSVMGVCALWASPALAGSTGGTLLPLETETAAPLRSGIAQASIGASYYNNLRFPYFTPANQFDYQDVAPMPQFGLRIGAGDWAEFQISYELIYLDEETKQHQTNWQYGSGDVRVGAKFRLLEEYRNWPALSLRISTKLPNANFKDLLGTDEFDFGSWALISKDFGAFSAHANLGLVLLGNPGSTVGNFWDSGGQDDLFSYSIAVVSRPLGQAHTGSYALRAMGEFVGQTGSRFDNDRQALRFGVQVGRGGGLLYLGPSVGLVTASENIGVSGGFIYTFDLGATVRALRR
jgi:hypothetical protein